MSSDSSASPLPLAPKTSNREALRNRSESQFMPTQREGKPCSQPFYNSLPTPRGRHQRERARPLLVASSGGKGKTMLRRNGSDFQGVFALGPGGPRAEGASKNERLRKHGGRADPRGR